MSDRPFNNLSDTVAANLAELQKVKDDPTLSVSEKKAAISRALPKVVGRWNELQNILLDVEVGHRVKLLADSTYKMPSLPDMIHDLESEVKSRYKDQAAYEAILLYNLPTRQVANKWVSLPDWKEEVEKRLKDGNLFSLDKRAALIQSLYKKGMDGDNKSAEMWLKMSGDLTNTPQTKDKAVETFKSISQSLFNEK